MEKFQNQNAGKTEGGGCVTPKKKKVGEACSGKKSEGESFLPFLCGDTAAETSLHNNMAGRDGTTSER